jgi:translation initiation factor IF-3
MSAKLPNVNSQITASEIRLIDINGQMVGIVPLQNAIKMASEARVDLIEISPNANPPVCKIMDFGKYKYELQKKQSEAKSKQVVIEQKDVKFAANIGIHDYNTKMKNIFRFISEGHRVRVIGTLRGREKGSPQRIMDLFNRIISEIGDSVSHTDPAFVNEGSAQFIISSKTHKK